MEYLKSKEQVVSEKLGLISEATKVGDVWRVTTVVEVPKSLINAFVSKSKKENDIDPRETFGDMLLADLFVKYVIANYMTIESLPVTGIMGEKPGVQSEVQTTIQPEEIVQTPPVDGAVVEPIAQPVIEPVVATQGEPTAEIQLPQ